MLSVWSTSLNFHTTVPSIHQPVPQADPLAETRDLTELTVATTGFASIKSMAFLWGSGLIALPSYVFVLLRATVYHCLSLPVKLLSFPASSSSFADAKTPRSNRFN